MTEVVQEAEFTKRQAYIQSLKRFLVEQQEKISQTLETLGWSPEHFIKPQNRVVCPLDGSHVMPEGSLAEHVRKCQLLKSGVQKYQLEDVLNEESRVKNNLTNTVKLGKVLHLLGLKLLCSEIGDLGITLFPTSKSKPGKIIPDEATLNSILWDNAVAHGHVYTGQRKLPTTHEDEKVILTPQERLAVHDYIASEAKSLGLMMNVEKDENLTTDWEKIIKKGVLQKDDDESMTVIEKLAALRDFKRRRQSYRAKNVHITKKSYTEIIHEVIGNQMEMWGAEMKAKTDGQKDSDGQGSDIYIKDKEDRREDRAGDHDVKGDRYEKEDREGHRDRNRYREAERGYERYRERRSYKEYDRGYDYKDYRDRYEQGPSTSRRDSDRERGESRRDSDRDRGESRRDREGDRDRHRDGDRYRDRYREGDRYRDRESESDGNRYREREGRRDDERDRPRGDYSRDGEGERDRGRGDYVREGERERDSWKESGRWERSYDRSEGKDREREKSYGRDGRGSRGREEGQSRYDDDMDDMKNERSKDCMSSTKRDPMPERNKSSTKRRSSNEDEFKMRRGSIKSEVKPQEMEEEEGDDRFSSKKTESPQSSRDVDNYTQGTSKEKESSKRQRSKGRDGSKERKKAKIFQETVQVKSSIQRETISKGEAREITVEHSSKREVEENDDSDSNSKTDRTKESKHKHKKSKKSKKHKHKHKHKHRKRSSSTASDSGQSQQSD